jgi:hypothetical protein
MWGSTKPIGIIALGMVTKHIPSKPQRDHSSKHDYKKEGVVVVD